MSIAAEYSSLTVGILFPGELGSKLASCFTASGLRVVTSLAGRSERTGRLCRESGVEVLENLQGVAEVADVAFSVVTPGSAIDVAERYLGYAAHRQCPPVFVDVNSVGPATIARIENLATAAGISLVDAKVHGLASTLTNGAVMYLSGSDASRVASLVPSSLRTWCLDGQAGQAAALKMFIGGLNKITTALFLDISRGARQAGVLDEFLQRTSEYYPGIMEVVERLLPTMSQHSSRRAEEMGELALTLEQLGLSPGFALEAQRSLASLRSSDAPSGLAAIPTESLALKEFVQHLSETTATTMPSHPLHERDADGMSSWRRQEKQHGKQT